MGVLKKDVTIVKPALLPILKRVSVLFVCLLAASFVSFTIFSRGIGWIYDEDRQFSPFLGCPDFILNAYGANPTGPVCRVNLVYSMGLASSLIAGGVLTVDAGTTQMGLCTLSSSSSPESIFCYVDAPCDLVCKLQTNFDSTTLSDLSASVDQSSVKQYCLVNIPPVRAIMMACFEVRTDAFCDSGFRVTPNNEIAMRGVVIASVMIVLIWIFAEWLLRRVDIDLRREVAEGRSRQAAELPEKISLLRQLVETRWDREGILDEKEFSTTRNPEVESLFTPKSGFSSPLRSPPAEDPRERFLSGDWKRRVRRYHALHAAKGEEFRVHDFARSLFLSIFYFFLIVVTLLLILLASPQHISPSSSSMSGLVSVWRIHSVLDAIIFLDILLDFVMFVVASVVIEWPPSPLFAEHLQKRLGTLNEEIKVHPSSPEVVSLAGSSSSVDTQSLSFVLKQALWVDCCLLIACHESTLTEEKSASFSNTLECALKIFTPSHIFVCDNGPWLQPQDETQFLAKQVHPEINYVYIPEGNKTFAFYWTNKHWIPFLNRCGVVPNFTYALIIDDDVPLPPDLHIPLEHLKQRPEIKAVHFPITAATRNNLSPNLLVKCQDVEYKLAAVHKQFQSRMSRCLSCHGAVALWERNAMGEVFFSHDTVFHGEDMYMGLSLLRKRDASLIISAAQSIVPTYAPEKFPVLFRQRVKSWELTSHRKTLTYLKEVLAPTSFCHAPSLVLKPYFLQEVITILLDWLRIYLLCGLFLRDWLGLLLMTAFFMSLMYIQVFLFTFIVLRSRKNLAPSFCTVLVFPFYRLCGLLFRICALCHNLLVYSHDRTAVKIGKREDEIKDIPPTPPSATVDWFTVWKVPENGPKH